MYTPKESIPRVGRVAIDVHGKSYRLRFTYPEGKTHSFSIARVTEEGWITTIKAAKLINRDIDLDDFDDSYARYSPRHAKRLRTQQVKKNREYTLQELWEAYKVASENRVTESTKKGYWRTYDLIFVKLPSKLKNLSEARNFVLWLQKNYSDTTIASLFRTTINPSVNMAVQDRKIQENPFEYIKLNKIPKNEIQCFEPDEVKKIIAAFYSNRYNPKSSRHQHSYYAPLVEFLALTGCRPEEAYALTWNDIKQRSGRTFIRFNKAYTKGVLLDHTKNHTVRLFPCNKQLQDCLERAPRKKTEALLIFPAIKGGYISQNGFRRHSWTKVVKSLAKEGEIDRYLKPYCLRHSFITRLVREGVDMATVARLSGNSPETIVKHYLASRTDYELPEL